jgi:hypothetical protein
MDLLEFVLHFLMRDSCIQFLLFYFDRDWIDVFICPFSLSLSLNLNSYIYRCRLASIYMVSPGQLICTLHKVTTLLVRILLRSWQLGVWVIVPTLLSAM